MNAAQTSSASWHAPHNPWLIAVVATLATFMEVLDTSIANVSLPHIAGNLGASINDSTWVLTSYLVANAVVLPASAWLSSLIGRRNYFMLAIGMFTIASLLCGVAPNLELLVAFRLIQGLAGGGLQPLTQAILIDTFPPHLRGMGMAVFGMTVVVAPVIGPTFGGWITDNYDWRWVFLINIPVGAFALWATRRWITDPPFLRRRTGVDRWRGDFFGLGLVALGLGSTQFVLDLGEREDWFSSGWIVTAAITAVIALVWGVVRALDHERPMIDFRVLHDRDLSLACVFMLIFGAVLFGTTALLPMMTQTLLGYTAQLSGLVLSPGGMVVAVLMPLVGAMVSRTDPRRMILFGVVVVAASLWLMSGYSLDVDFGTLVAVRMLQGLGLAFMFVPINTIAYAGIPAQERNSASGLISIARNMGGSIGIGITSTLIARNTQVHRAQLIEHLTPTDPAFSSALGDLTAGISAVEPDHAQAELMANALIVQSAERHASMLSYIGQFAALAAAFLLLVPVVLSMRRPARLTRPPLVTE